MIRQQSLRLQRQSSLRLPSSRREERAVGEADVDPLALHVDTPRREEPLGWQWRTLFYRARSWLGEAQSQLLDGVRAAAASVSLGGRWPCGVSFTLGGCLAGVVLAGLLMRSFLDNAASVHEPVGLLTSSAQPRSARQHTPPSAVACAALRELQVCSHQASVVAGEPGQLGSSVAPYVFGDGPGGSGASACAARCRWRWTSCESAS